MHKLNYLTLALCLVIAGCGSKSKLTSEQKAEFGATMESTGRGQKVSQTHVSASGRTSAISRGADSKKPDDIESKIYSKLQAAGGSCEMPTPKGLDGSFDPSGGMKIEWSLMGAGCPVVMNYSMDFSIKGGKEGVLQLDLSYQVQDAEIKKLNDVYGMTLAGKITGNQSGGGGTLTGNITSAKHGKIPVSLGISGTSEKMDFTYNVEMPKAPVELKMTMTKDGKTTHTINGEDITAQEFQDYLAKGGPGFMALGQFQGSQQSGGGADHDHGSHGGHGHGTSPVLGDDDHSHHGLR